MIKAISVIVVAAVISANASAAFARSTGWVSGFEWIRISKTLDKNGEMPVSVVCKDSGSKGLTNISGLAKVEIQKNPGNVAWYWAYGARVKQVKARLEKRGFKLVSFSEYRRSSGLKIPCAIWHKKK
ncbi:hypothetical protein [Rhizobium sp. LjRoot254]|uniref:hypothetical protein n=1 Tax=Rhizobium sp. LjRoot254 TaxID=3342297 RepID=UPI003ECE0799